MDKNIGRNVISIIYSGGVKEAAVAKLTKRSRRVLESRGLLGDFNALLGEHLNTKPGEMPREDNREGMVRINAFLLTHNCDELKWFTKFEIRKAKFEGKLPKGAIKIRLG